jgi:hypothetical protein
MRVGAAGGALAPAGALSVADGQVAARVSRLLRPAPGLSVLARGFIAVAAVVIVAIPIAVLAVPL